MKGVGGIGRDRIRQESIESEESSFLITLVRNRGQRSGTCLLKYLFGTHSKMTLQGQNLEMMCLKT